jgi:hypothetical protein
MEMVNKVSLNMFNCDIAADTGRKHGSGSRYIVYSEYAYQYSINCEGAFLI